MLLSLVLFFLLLSVLVLIHELGHFLVAKRNNIKVEEFGFGLPPRIYGIKRGETIYSINWLPIGGFVKMYGEDEAGSGRVDTKKKAAVKTADLERAFFSKTVGQRAAVVVAGVVMNTLLAVLIFYGYMLLSGFRAELPLLTDHKFFAATTSVSSVVTIENVAKDSPASKAGIPPFARIVSVNGKKVSSIDTFTKEIKTLAGKQTVIRIIDPKTNKQTDKIVVPRLNPPKGQGALGVSLFGMATATLEYKTPLQKVLSGITHPINLLSYNFDLMGQLISASIRRGDASALSQGVSGPVGIYSVVGTIVKIPDLKLRVLEFLNLAGILSISLAFFNILPIPALDGGRLFFIVIEGVLGKKVNPKYEELAHTIGMAVLLTLIVLITFKDIFQFLLN